MQKPSLKSQLQKAALLGCALLLAAGLAACSAGKSAEHGKTQNTVQSAADSAVPGESSAPSDGETPTAPQSTSEANALTLPDVGSLSVHEAMEKLQAHYGDGYTVNGRTGDENSYSFQVYAGDTLYARVVVNLQSGEATETKSDTGKQSQFVLQ